ncbi:DNA cytosine methyltransferase [Bacillus anthracis]|uniref:DNA cytosine methyltransferase n=1 Tax=Bacillus anthracis TaxID=1392 RepID=UPI001D0EB557|nr:DNA (cytosine-5-)-methyltransferase [Bacillus anthracis]MCC2347481.1 DNA cytosine methyltransferase [Bacillus anthracis]
MELDSYKKPTVVSLLCGAGGMDYGFQKAGFKSILGIDIDKNCCETYKNWSRAKVANIDLNKVNLNQIPNSDVIIGYLPVPRSSIGKKERVNSKGNLLNTVLKIIEYKRPKAFVFESTAGLLISNKREDIKTLLNTFETLGYRITYELMNSSDYGIAQNRKILVMVGVREDLCLRYKFPLKDNLKVTVRDVLKDVDIKSKEGRKIIEPGKIYKYNRAYKIIDLDDIAPPLNVIQNIVIRSDNGDYVSLLCEEVAAIQSFSKDVIFEGLRGSKMRQIKRAFPPKLAFLIAEGLREALNCKGIINVSVEKRIVNNNSQLSITNSNPVDTSEVCRKTKQLSLVISEGERIVTNNSHLSITNSNAVDSRQVPKSIKQLCSTPSVKKIVVNENELMTKIKKIIPGIDHADNYQDWVFESLKYIFDKELRRGRQEELINEGRKRIDIVFDNKESEGFFWELNSLHHIRCAKILVECKNYTGELKNPEFDQLIGRFNKNYSEFGILTCRSIKDEKRNRARCKDAINSGKGYVLTLCDTDILTLLKLRNEKRYEDISDYMRALYEKIFR